MADVPELLQDGLPQSWSLKSRLKASFRCRCGSTFSMTFSAFKTGRTTCGQCDMLKRGDKSGGFVYDDEPASVRSSARKFFVCEKCGQRDLFVVKYAASSKSRRCRNCCEVTLGESERRTFGRLRVKKPTALKKYSVKQTVWVCTCGNEIVATVSNVVNGVTKSCGKCRKNAKDWHTSNVLELSQLKYPVSPSDFPPGGVVPLQPIVSGNAPFDAMCPACGATYRPRMNDIKRGISLNCGCASSRVSSGQQGILDFLAANGVHAQAEFEVDGMKYDVGVPSKRILIEHNGLRWHSGKQSHNRDARKFAQAMRCGWGMLSIFEDEWANKREVFGNLILNRVGRLDCLPMRPSKTQVGRIQAAQADAFYDKHHYLGGCCAKFNFSAAVNGEVVACVSFKKPTRQSKHSWELVRMASNPRYRVHGIWHKLLREFAEGRSGSVVSFSDNRLFTGSVYEKLGFVFDGDVAPDYYWTRGQKRWHKSALRKPPGCEATESKLRESQGYTKIWDLGKKRWVMQLT
jgi:hypothetical protein